MDGVDAVRASLAAHGEPDEVLVCSSAGGGLRLAVVGYEREVTAEAGHRVGLSAGAKVVHVASGAMTGEDVGALRAARPDLVLLVGGTDGGNADVLLHNAARLARARAGRTRRRRRQRRGRRRGRGPAGATGRRHVVTAQRAAPHRGHRAGGGAAAIREAFLTHVIGGKGLSRGRGFAELVRAPTPDAVLRGVEVLADVVGGDVLVVDVGGATTDVYSVITPQGEDATIHREVVGTLWHARTVEADLGCAGTPRASSRPPSASASRCPTGRRYAAAVAADTGHLASSAAAVGGRGGARLDGGRRRRASARPPPHPSERPRPLADVALVVGSGGVLRHAPGARGPRARAGHRRPRRGVAGAGRRAADAWTPPTCSSPWAARRRATRVRRRPWRRRSPPGLAGVGAPGPGDGEAMSTDWPWAEEFEAEGTYLNSATMGLPPRATLAALAVAHGRVASGHRPRARLRRRRGRRAGGVRAAGGRASRDGGDRQPGVTARRDGGGSRARTGRRCSCPRGSSPA